jgi:hypothetical protein
MGEGVTYGTDGTKAMQHTHPHREVRRDWAQGNIITAPEDMLQFIHC